MCIQQTSCKRVTTQQLWFGLTVTSPPSIPSKDCYLLRLLTIQKSDGILLRVYKELKVIKLFKDKTPQSSSCIPSDTGYNPDFKYIIEESSLIFSLKGVLQICPSLASLMNLGYSLSLSSLSELDVNMSKAGSLRFLRIDSSES